MLFISFMVKFSYSVWPTLDISDVFSKSVVGRLVRRKLEDFWSCLLPSSREFFSISFPFLQNEANSTAFQFLRDSNLLYVSGHVPVRLSL